MKQIQSKISEKNQVVIPAVVRRVLKLRAGDKLIWRILRMKDKPKAIAEAEPKSWANYTRGLGKNIWKSVEIDKYIRELRSEWENRG